MRARKAVQDGAWMLATQGAVVACGLLVLALLTRVLTDTELAAWALVEPFLAVATSVCTLGLIGALYQRVPTAMERGEIARVRWLVRVALCSQLVLVIPLATLAFMLAPWLAAHLLRAPGHADLVRLIAVLLVSGRLYEQSVLVTSSLDRLRLVGIVRILHDVLVRLASVFVLVMTRDVRFLFGSLALFEIVLVAGLWVYQRDLVLGNVERGSLRQLLRSSLPFYGKGFLRLGTLHADKLAVGALLGPSQLATYYVAARFYNYLTTLADSLVAPMLPKLSAVRLHGPARLGETLKRASRFVDAAIVPAAAYVAVCSGPLLQLVAGERYAAAKPVLALLCVAATLYALYSLYGAVIYVAAEPSRTMALEGIGSVVSIGLVVLFGATMGLTGVAMARVLGSVAMLFVGTRLIRSVADGGIDRPFLLGLLQRIALPIACLAVFLKMVPALEVFPLLVAASGAVCVWMLVRWVPPGDLDLVEDAAPRWAQSAIRTVRRVIGRQVGVSA